MLLVPQSGAAPGLSHEHLRQIGEARLRWTKLRRAVTVARFNGWATAIFAGLTLLGGLFSLIGLGLGAGLAIVATVEFRGARRLRQLDSAAPSSLAINQLFLGGLLLTYAVYRLWHVPHDASIDLGELRAMPEAANVVGAVDGLARTIGLLVYGTLAAVAVLGQGGMACFYTSRRPHLDDYVRRTPAWLLDAQRAGLAL